MSKEADFHERSFLLGHPPKVIWIRRGNCSTDEVLSLLQTAHAAIIQFEADPEASLSSARLTRSPTHHATAAR